MEEIETRVSTHASGDVSASASVYVTSSTPSAEQEQKLADDESKLPSAKPSLSRQVGITHGTRPNLPDHIEAMAASGAGGKRVGIFVCGPESMLHDVRNAAARAQRGVLGGKGGDGLEEVYLHLEPFS